MIILGENEMSAGMKRYWKSATFLSRMERMKIQIVDPWRSPLRKLRKEFPGKVLYRASTGGRFGKSSEVIKL